MFRLFGRQALIALALLTLLNNAAASLPEIQFSAERIRNETFVLKGVQGQIVWGGQYELQIQNATIDGVDQIVSEIAVAGAMEESTVFRGQVTFTTEMRPAPFQASYRLSQTPDGVRAAVNFSDIDLLTLKSAGGLPTEAQWLSRGQVDAAFSYIETRGAAADLKLGLALSRVGFDSPGGRFAADALSLRLDLEAKQDAWTRPEIEGSITSGELLIDDFYRNFSEGDLEFAIEPTWDDSGVNIRSFSISDNYSVEISGKAAFEFGDSANAWRAEINRLDLKFPGAYERYMEPMAAVYTLDGLGVTGRVSWNGDWSEGSFHSGDLIVTDLSIVDIQRNRFAFTGLDARMRPGDHTFDSKLGWRGLLMGRINLGPGELALDSEPGRFAIVKPLELEVMGGQVRLNEFSLLLPGGSANDFAEPDIRLNADLVDLDMEQLTVAFDWPLFSGKISGHIPGASYDDGVLDVEGQIRVDVFDGTLLLDDLKVERPFGVLPSLAANIEATNLDLMQLTQTFSFGQISGRIDGYIRELRMLDWKPVAFDAWFGTPGNQKGSRGISRQAVNHLTTLGGGRATTALTGPVMRLFNNFSYKSLGLGCRMQNNTCEIRGVKEDDVSVLLMEGAGIPKITIRAFNRRVDWPQLMSQLLAASEGDSIKIGD